MNVFEFGRSLRRWWWVLALATVLGGGAAFAYSEHQVEQFEASSTVVAHPAASLKSPSESLQQVSALAYGSLMATFASVAESASVGRQAVSDLTVADGSEYKTRADVLPKTTVLRISVEGPDRAQTVRLANRVATIVAERGTKSFPTVSLTRLDPATSASLTRPKTGRNILYGTLAGFLVGLVLVALLPAGSRRSAPRGSTRSGNGEAKPRGHQSRDGKQWSPPTGSSREVGQAAPDP